MRITRLHLRDFRRHADLDIRPAAGLTIISGPNEAGKSTIAEALEVVLFRKAESADQATLEVGRWGSDEPPSVTLEFVADDVAGRLTKTFGARRGSVELALGEEVLHDPNAVQRRLEAITGLPSERFFRATASVRHHELTAIGADDRQLSHRLGVVVSGADRATAQARRMLEDAIRRYRSEGDRDPGLLVLERDGSETLQRRLDEGEAALVRLETDRAAWVAAHERRLDLDARVARAEADVAEAEQAAALVERRDAARARYERLRRAAELDAERRELASLPLPPLPLAQLRAHVARIERAVFELSELEAELAIGADDASLAGMPRPPRIRPFLVAAMLVGAVAAGVAVLLADPLRLPLALGLAAIAVGITAWSWRVAREARRVSLAVGLARAGQIARRKSVAESQEGFRRARRRLEGLVETIGVDSAEAAARVLAGAESRAAELGRVEAELRGRLGEEVPDDLVAARDEAAGDAERAEHALADLGDMGLDPAAAVQRTRAALAAIRPERDAARSEEDQALGRASGNETDAEEVAAISEELTSARARLAVFERRLRVYQATLEAIRRAETATMRSTARFLEQRMGPDMARITGGRYRRVRVDESDLSFRVWAPESGDYVPASQLSRGTADQLYLVARLGLVRLVTMDRRPPLILDDPFVTFDIERAGRALELVKLLAAEQGFQVLYLSASERHAELADAIVRLEPPLSRDEAADGAAAKEPA